MKRYERIQSAILVILVLVSLLLTWNLWTYQPNYETMDKSNYVAEVQLSAKQEVKKIVRPDMVLFHLNGDHYGTTDVGELEKLIQVLSHWSFYNVKSDPEKTKNFNEWIHGNKKVEIIFPAEVPVNIYRNVLNFTERKIPAFNFDRIIINVDSSQRANGMVYFASTSSRQVYSSQISSNYLTSFFQSYYKHAIQFPHYFAYIAGKRMIFLPVNKTDMKEYKFLPVTLDSDEFKDALFSDPSFVQKSFVPKGEEYTNGSSKMSVNNAKNLLLYVNPTADLEYQESSEDLVKRSIDFVNGHGGWTDSYRYVGKEEADHNVTFRLYSSAGYPVFNEGGLSEITETWGRNDINKYVRPNISLELPLNSETQNVVAPSGYAALKFLQSKRGFKPELLENLVLGYEMKRDLSQSKLITFKPMWFYRYDHKWNQMNIKDLGGTNNGLE